MLYQELPRIDSTPLDKWGRWLAPALIGAAALSIAVILLLVGSALLSTTALLIGALAIAGAILLPVSRNEGGGPLVGGPDYALVSAALGL